MAKLLLNIALVNLCPAGKVCAQELSASGLRLSVLPLGRADAVEALTEGRADLALGFIWDLPDTIMGDPLYEETFLVTDLPQALPDAPLVSLDAYCAADHVLISPAGGLRGVVDDRLAAMGRSRTITLGLPAFLPALAAVVSSGALLTLPARLAQGLASGFGLVTATPPLEVFRFPVSVFWHRRNSADPRTIWLRDELVQVLNL
ncbi:LysR substrate-binding domain-containing protein [Szabonella alba]|uniref:LysR substrate-binding domain-containing protein n=1 Tax=Szabonella alba TaxID=2804194 RepID=UPI0030803BBE